MEVSCRHGGAPWRRRGYPGGPCQTCSINLRPCQARCWWREGRPTWGNVLVAGLSTASPAAAYRWDTFRGRFGGKATSAQSQRRGLIRFTMLVAGVPLVRHHQGGSRDGRGQAANEPSRHDLRAAAR